MKIDKVQCDICGKIVDYNDQRMKNILKNNRCSRYEDENGLYLRRFRTNNLAIYGITKEKNINVSCTNNEDVMMQTESDLCEECLIDLHKMINEWKNQRSEENEFSS